jgi:cytochrome c nitrite reductase small subunit
LRFCGCDAEAYSSLVFKSESFVRSIAISLLAAVILGVAVGLAAYTFIYAKGYSYLTNNPAACANCHVMQAQYDAWMKSSHHSVAACNDCHTPHNIVGKYAVKANNGFWHSFYFTSGRYPDTIEITKFDHQVVENACRRCHESITSAIDGNVVHGKAKGLECTRCHNSVGHSESASAGLISIPTRSPHEQSK